MRQCVYVLRKTTAAKADTGKEELVADTAVAAAAETHFVELVSAALAQVGDRSPKFVCFSNDCHATTYISTVSFNGICLSG